MVRIVLLILWLAIPLTAQSIPDTPEANPGRPTVATPATLTPAGYLQFESGALAAWTSPEFSSRQSLNEVIKLSVHRRLQFLLLMEPIAHGRRIQRLRTSATRGSGLQAVLVPGEGRRPTVAVGYIRQLRNSGASDFDIGSATDSLSLLVSDDLARFHFDINGFINRQADAGRGRAQYGQTISISHAVQKFTIAAELWHFTQPFSNSNAVGNLWALSYPVRKNLVVDGGFEHGFTSTSTRWQVFAGFTYLLPHRLW